MKNRYKQKLIFVIAILCLSLVSCKSKTEPINNIASWTPDDGWTINGIDIRDDYANFTLLYQDREIANVEISKFAEPSWIDRETAADEFVQVYLGQHAELKSSSELQLDRKEEKIQKLQEQKQDLSNMFIENNNGSITQMSTADIIDLFK